jgi:serine/threonine protein kinase
LVLASNTSRKVVKIGEDVVVKFGSKVGLDEVESMMFIRENTAVSVPKILDAYSQDGKNYIIMEYIPGSLLKNVWDSLLAEDKSVITKEMRDYVCQLRRLPMPTDGLIGSVTGGLAVDRRQLGAVRGGPFPSEMDFNAWQLAQLHPEVALSQREMYASLHKADHRLVFTHGDLAFHNIIVKDGHVNAIIDWEYSGWYPEHWDYCKTRSFLGGTDEEYFFCKEIYEKQYHAEYFLDTWFGREVLHGGF